MYTVKTHVLQGLTPLVKKAAGIAWLNNFLLKSRNPGIRCKAIENLAESGRSRDTELIFASLTDSNPQVRCAAVRALEKRNNQDSVPSLIGALKDSSFAVRQAAAQALGRLGDQTAIDPLTSALRDADPAVRTAAAVALRTLRWRPSNKEELARFEIALGNTPVMASLGEAALDPLVAELKNETSFYRRAAAEALRDMNDPRKVRPLLEALYDRDSSVRISAIHSLQHVTSDEVTAALVRLFRDADANVRLAAVEIMARRPDATPTHFICLLEDKSFEIRKSAVQFLSRFRNPNIGQVLLPLLADPDLDVRQETAAALGGMGNQSAIEGLVICLGDEDRLVRKAAERSLDQLNPNWFESDAARNARPQLEALLEVRSEWVRPEIQQLLARLPVAAISGDEYTQHQSVSPF